MKVDLATGAQTFTEAAEGLADAIKAGDLDLAQARYPAAAAAYRGIEANARRFGDLHAAIAATATYYANGPADPAFSGLHRIEYGLFSQRSLDGLAPIADRLVTDSETLGQRLSALKPAPDMLAGNAAAYLAALGHAIPSGEELYAQTELGDLDAALAATARTVALVRPIGQRTDATLMKDIEDRLKTARGALDALRGPEGCPSYDTVSADTRAALSQDFAALGESLAALDTKLGLQ